MFYAVQLQSTKAVTVVMDCFCIQLLFYIVLEIVNLVIWMRLHIVLSMINIHGHSVFCPLLKTMCYIRCWLMLFFLF